LISALSATERYRKKGEETAETALFEENGVSVKADSTAK
jgi:hypothetical protein